MNREIKNDGIYVEIDADEIVENLTALKEAKVVVVKKARIEMAGAEKDDFLRKFEQILEIVNESDSYSDLDSRQKSDVVLRGFLV